MLAHSHRVSATGDRLLKRPGLAQQVLDLLDMAVVAVGSDGETPLLMNVRARELLGGERLPADLVDAICDLNAVHASPRRITLSGRFMLLRVVRASRSPRVDVLFLREESVRKVDNFHMLSTRYGITRRQFRVLAAIGVGKTNAQIAAELGLTQGSVAQHVHRLLRVFGVTNRTSLATLIDRILSDGGMK